MLAENKLKTFLDLVESSSNEELAWMNGYLNGVASKQLPKAEQPVATNGVSKITIAYGTETGNSKKLAADLALNAKKNGIHAKLVSLDQYRLNDLTKEEYFLTIISTHGEGEPPGAAKKFYDHIHHNGFRLDKLKYSVLALGDTSYPLFCKTGEDVDAQLQKLGGIRIAPLRKCDTDFEDEAGSWFREILQSFSSNGSSIEAAPAVVKRSTGKKTFEGTVLSTINLNDTGSNKETYHIEIAAEDLNYLPGDSIGIVPENPGTAVEKIIALSKIDAVKNVKYKEQDITVSELLLKKLNITYLPERVVTKYASLVQEDIALARFDLVELLETYPLKDDQQFEDLVNILEPITPRLYSISSSPQAHDGEVHITVAKDRFKIFNEEQFGLCSDFLSKLNDNGNLSFYVHPNNQFRLPDAGKDIIMIGPGTGIAPFRSFLAERDATGATGRNWLFFGDQHFESDFLYQSEIQDWVTTGVLTKVNVAFSRDQQQKIYVQHKMLKHGADFFEWLETGAYVYVCGAKEPMSVDVENTLLQIIEEFGNKSKEEAQNYLDDLKTSGRYLKDVY